MSSIKQVQKGGIKSKIICKYFILGKCIKGENCPYLHSQIEKPKEMEQVECPMYSIGFCKNGPVCHFLHIKRDKYIKEEIEEKNTTSTTPINEEQNNSSNNNIKGFNTINNNSIENNMQKEKDNKEENNIEKVNFPELPIWYLEHYYEKPISMIYSELEQKNLPEIIELKKKYGFINIEPNLPILQPINKKIKTNINMNTLNLNFNNFNMNLAFNNNHTDINKKNSNIIQNSIQANKDMKIEQYKLKKDSIEYLINNEDKVFYYLIRCKNYDEIKKSLETNIIALPEELFNRYKDIDLLNNKLIIIIFIFDNEYENLHGFAKLKYPFSEKNFEQNDKKIYINNYKIEWLWRTKLNFSKISHLMNRADDDHFLNEGKNGCPIDKDLGNYCCRLMIKRLSKDEVKELIKEKGIFENHKLLIQNLRKGEEHVNNNSHYNIKSNNNSKFNNYELGKYNVNEYSDKKNNNKYHEKYLSKNYNNNNKKYYNDINSNKNNNFNKKEFNFTRNKKYRNNSKSRSHNRTDSDDYSSKKHNKKMKINDEYEKNYEYVNNRYKYRPKKDFKELNDYHRYRNDDNKSTDFSSKKSFH